MRSKCRIFFTKERIHRKVPEMPAHRGWTRKPPPSASTGPLRITDTTSPARKAHAHEKNVRRWQYFEHVRTMARRGQYEEKVLHKPEWGRTAPVCIDEFYERASSWLLPTIVRGQRAAVPNMMATSGFQRPWVHIHSIIQRAVSQRATHNINMAVDPEERGKLAHGRLQPTLPVCAKTRK